MKKITRGIKLLSVLFMALAYLGCDEDDAVLPQVEAQFTQTINQDTGVVSFLNTSTNTDTYSWDFGDGTTSTEVNPIKVYPSGTYTVVLEASNVAGASDTFEDTIVISIPEAIGFPISFDNANVNYNASVFGGTTFQIVENPDPSGSNTEVSNVGELTNSGATFEGVAFDLDIDLSSNNAIVIDFWSESAVDILLKLENPDDANDFTEAIVSHTGSGWEELTFVYTSTSTFPRLTIFVDGPGTTAGTFFFDNISQANVTPPCTPETEESGAAADLNITFQTDSPTFIEDNVGFSVIDNPDSENSVNNSCRVGQVARAGASGFDNLQLDLADKLDFSSVDGIKLKVWSPEANTPVLLKLEEIGNGGNFVEIPQTVTNANEWTELTFDFDATATPQFDKMVIFFGFNQQNSNTYFFDDLMVFGTGSGGGGGGCTAETSESSAAADLNVTFLTDTPTFIEDNAGFNVIDNPDFSNAVNTSCRVAQVNRGGASGFDNVQLDLTDKLDFNSVEGMKMKVWSPEANTPVLLKLEEIGNGGNFVEILQTVTNANEWTELTFDFDATATPQFNKIVLFFGFNQQNSNTYFFDDLMVFGTPGGGGGGGGSGTGGNCTTGEVAAAALPVNFEGCETFLQSQNFGGGLTSGLDANPNPSGINTSANVLRIDKPTGSEFFAGVQNNFASNFDLSNPSHQFKMKIYSTKANATFRFEVAQDDPGVGNPPGAFVTVANANVWTEVTFTFTAIPAPTSYFRLVIKPDNDMSDSPITNGGTYYIDDIELMQ